MNKDYNYTWKFPQENKLTFLFDCFLKNYNKESFRFYDALFN